MLESPDLVVCELGKKGIAIVQLAGYQSFCQDTCVEENTEREQDLNETLPPDF